MFQDTIICSRQWTAVRHEGKNKIILTTTAQIHQIGNQAPYFSVTYTETDHYSRRRDDIASGGRGDYNTMIAPLGEQADVTLLARCSHFWHLARVTGKPMHYAENSLYWYDMTRGLTTVPSYLTVDPRDAFLNAIAFGALPFDTRFKPLTMPRNILIRWLDIRIDALRAAFQRDMRALFPGLTFDKWTSEPTYTPETAPAPESPDTDSLESLLAQYGIFMRCAQRADNPNMTDSDARRMTHWHINFFRRVGDDLRQMVTYFSMGAAYNGRTPTAAEVMGSLLRDAESAEMSYPEFASEFGYDGSEGRATWTAIRTNTRRLRAFLGEDIYTDLMAID